MGKRKEAALRVKPVLQKGAQSLDSSEALEVKGIYRTWEECVELGQIDTKGEPGYKFTYGDDLYSCVNGNPTFQSDWIPGTGTASLYTRIDEEHKGTFADPIPYVSGMVLVQGLYYEQYGVVYYCTYGSVIAVFSDLKDLVSLYVQPVEEEDDRQTSGLLTEDEE